MTNRKSFAKLVQQRDVILMQHVLCEPLPSPFCISFASFRLSAENIQLLCGDFSLTIHTEVDSDALGKSLRV